VNVNPIALLFRRGQSNIVRDVFVAGRKIVEDGVVIGVDLPLIERELTSYYKRTFPA
jgi:hypothetical protein